MYVTCVHCMHRIILELSMHYIIQCNTLIQPTMLSQVKDENACAFKLYVCVNISVGAKYF